MSAIVGVVNLNGKEIDVKTIKKMANVLKHRGPDGEDFFVENNVGLGHLFLNVLTKENLKQPLSNKQKNLWIVSDSEIFNNNDGSSAQTILNYYENKNNACVQNLDGPFSFVIYDKQKKILFCAVDQFGVKPLYYYHDSEIFLFSSEIKGILQHPNVIRQVNEKLIVEYLTQATVFHEETLFKGIKRLLPYHYLIVDLKKKNIEVNQYWDLNSKNLLTKISFDECVLKYKNLFEKSIQKRIQGWTSIGGTASGGIDSSSIVCTIDKLLKENAKQKKIKLQLISLNEELVNEKEFVETIVEKTNRPIIYVIPEPKILFKQLPEMLWYEEEPILLSTMYAWPITKIAKENKIQIISFGTAGDEVCAGYYKHFYRAFADLLKHHKYIKAFHEMSILANRTKEKGKLGNLKMLGYPGSKFPLLGLPIIFLRTLAIMYPSLRHIPYAFPEYRSPEKSPANVYLTHEFKKKYMQENKRKKQKKYDGYLNDMLYNHIMIISPDVRIVERLTMAHSITPIFPILDKDLVEFMFSVPSEFKMKESNSKAIPREAIKGIVPDTIRLRREKQGFGSHSTLFCIKNKDAILEILTSKSFLNRGIFDYKKIMDDFESLMTGNTKLGGDWLLRIVSLELWYRIFIDKNT